MVLGPPKSNNRSLSLCLLNALLFCFSNNFAASDFAFRIAATSASADFLELIPEIRKYYSFSTIIGASEPTKAKRPYLSIIRQLTKSKYKLNSYDYRIKQDSKDDIRTKKYIFKLL